ncbi:hypothetical protein P7K49_013497 [Saguinus oedipus]|uniref:Uncharacterized protein n=1 Tax=Saguinus oedipus TaxID=9490 RepID=A0ABQ9VG36_SAGOE|nr:hypothetical protein P7K49_013497 [Saguinus oedipus]
MGESDTMGILDALGDPDGSLTVKKTKCPRERFTVKEEGIWYSQPQQVKMPQVRENSSRSKTSADIGLTLTQLCMRGFHKESSPSEGCSSDSRSLAADPKLVEHSGLTVFCTLPEWPGVTRLFGPGFTLTNSRHNEFQTGYRWSPDLTPSLITL